MKVELSKLSPNPFRDFIVDPIDPGNVAALTESIKEDGFWGGVVCRQTKKGIEIAAGHTRVKAALKCGLETADLFVGHFSNDQMIRIYARENSTQRGNSTTAVAGSIISAIRFLARGILTEDPNVSRILETSQHGIEILRGQLVSGKDGVAKGIGVPALEKFLHGIPRLNQYIIEEQLATLKTSGDYQRVISEVTSEIEAEPETPEPIRENSRQAAKRVSGYKPEFDFAGVAPHLQNERQLRAFRQVVLKPGIKEILPVSKQADLAKHLVQKAKDYGEEISADFIRNNASNLAHDFKIQQRKLSRQEEAAWREADAHRKFDGLVSEFTSHARGLMESGNELIKFVDHYKLQHSIEFRIPETVKSAIRYTTEILNKLTRAL